MFFRILLTAFGIFLLCAVAPAQTSQPAPDDRLEFRAGQAFDRGNYAAALPMLRQLVTELKDRPAKLAVMQDRIKTCEQSLAKAGQSRAAGEAPRTPHPAPAPGQVLSMTIKELGNFNYDPDKAGSIPPDVQRLSGSTIRLTGFMIPVNQADRITEFALVPSLFSCCYGQPPQVQHTIVCVCPKGVAVSYDPDPIIVEGVLTVQEKRDEGYVTSIFQVEPKSIIETPKQPRK